MASAIVPAAGAGARFGGAKLSADIDGTPLLDRTVGALLAGGVDEVIVVTPPAAEWTAGISTLKNPRVTTVVNPDPSRGMFSSIQIGAAAVTGAPIAVLPGDMPFVRPDTVMRLLEAARRTGGIVSPRYGGRRGHPILLPGDVRAVLIDADATSNLNELLHAQLDRRVDLEVNDPGVLRDVDVKEDLAR